MKLLRLPLSLAFASLLVACGSSTTEPAVPSEEPTSDSTSEGGLGLIDTPADTGKQCGARAGDTCSATEFCAYKAGQYCGAADAQATCQPRPEVCAEIYKPVCGCDDKTYANECTANRAGVGFHTDGECPKQP